MTTPLDGVALRNAGHTLGLLPAGNNAVKYYSQRITDLVQDTRNTQQALRDVCKRINETCTTEQALEIARAFNNEPVVLAMLVGKPIDARDAKICRDIRKAWEAWPWELTTSGPPSWSRRLLEGLKKLVEYKMSRADAVESLNKAMQKRLARETDDGVDLRGVKKDPFWLPWDTGEVARLRNESISLSGRRSISLEAVQLVLPNEVARSEFPMDQNDASVRNSTEEDGGKSKTNATAPASSISDLHENEFPQVYCTGSDSPEPLHDIDENITLRMRRTVKYPDATDGNTTKLLTCESGRSLKRSRSITSRGYRTNFKRTCLSPIGDEDEEDEGDKDEGCAGKPHKQVREGFLLHVNDCSVRSTAVDADRLRQVNALLPKLHYDVMDDDASSRSGDSPEQGRGGHTPDINDDENYQDEVDAHWSVHSEVGPAGTPATDDSMSQYMDDEPKPNETPHDMSSFHSIVDTALAFTPDQIAESMRDYPDESMISPEVSQPSELPLVSSDLENKIDVHDNDKTMKDENADLTIRATVMGRQETRPNSNEEKMIDQTTTSRITLEGRRGIPGNNVEGAISSLKPDQWISSTAIEMCLRNQSNPTILVLDPHYLPADHEHRELQKLRITSLHRKVLVTIHHRIPCRHWTVAVVDLVVGVIEHYDSFGPGPYTKASETALLRFGRFLSQQARFCNLKWSFVSKSSPQQDNNIDCGIFAIVTGLYVITEISLPGTYNCTFWRFILISTLESYRQTVQKVPTFSYDTMLEDLFCSRGGNATSHMAVLSPQELRTQVEKSQRLSREANDIFLVVQRLLDIASSQNELTREKLQYHHTTLQQIKDAQKYVHVHVPEDARTFIDRGFRESEQAALERITASEHRLSLLQHFARAWGAAYHATSTVRSKAVGLESAASERLRKRLASERERLMLRKAEVVAEEVELMKLASCITVDWDIEK